MEQIESLYANGYITARQRLALSELVRIFTKDGADVKLDIRMSTKGGKLKKKASIKLLTKATKGK